MALCFFFLCLCALSAFCAARWERPFEDLLPISCAAFPVAMLGARLFHKEEMPTGAMFGILLALAGMFGLLLEM